MKFVPLTKIWATIFVSILAIAMKTPELLLALFGVEVILMLIGGILFRQWKALFALIGFSAFLGIVQYLGSWSVDSAIVTALRMLTMTTIFMMLIVTTKTQDLTVALVQQCRIPYAYAFMFTAALRFVPDFLRESKAVQEAQACRGMSLEGNWLTKIKSYMTVIQPLMLKSLSRSETMALSLELRGFGNQQHTFMRKVSLQAVDYVAFFVMLGATLVTLYTLWGVTSSAM